MNEPMPHAHDLVIWYRPPGRRVPAAIDHVVLNHAGHYVSEFTGKTLEQLASDYPAPVMTDWRVFMSEHENAFKTEATAVTRDEFMEALCVLPPARYMSTSRIEVFSMSERLSGAMTRWYVRLGDKHLTFVDHFAIPFERAISKVMDAALEIDLKELEGGRA